MHQNHRCDLPGLDLSPSLKPIPVNSQWAQRLKIWGLFIGLFWGLVALSPVSAAEIPVRVVNHLEQPVELKGDWFFKGPDQQTKIILLPSGWERAYQRRLPYFGKGEFRLKLVFDSELVGQVLQLNTDYIGGGKFRFWLNGQLVGHNGTSLNSLSRRPHFWPFILNQHEQILRVEVENHTFHLSGLVRPIWIGQAEQIADMRTRFLINRDLILGVFVFLGLMHLVIYFFFLRQKTMFWFGVVCLSAGVYTELFQVHNLEYLFGDLPLDWSVRLMRTAVATIFPSFLWYTYYLSPKFISIRLAQSFSWMNFVFLMLFMLDEKLYAYLIGPWFLLAISCIVYNLYLLFRFVKGANTWPFVFSGVAFALTLLNDLLNILGVIQTAIVARYGLLCFCFAQVGLLAVRFQQSYQQTLHLQGELLEVNQNLDNLVQVRTAEVRIKNQELNKLVRFKDEMTHMLAHDLKTPLNTLINLGSGTSTELKAHIQTQSRQMLKLIDNLLFVRQSDHSQLNPDLKLVNLQRLMAQVIENVSPWALSKKISLNSQVSEHLQISIDPLLCERVFQNLLDNAIKHTPSGGQIEVKALLRPAVSPEWIELQITDSGPGISPNRLELIFEKRQSFAQATVPQSSGWGLYFCRQVIEAHRGHIVALNVPGGGCMMQIEFPLTVVRPEHQIVHWTPEQLQILRPVAEQLERIKVYAVTHVQAVLQNHYNHDPQLLQRDSQIQNWLLAVEYAVSEVNEKDYANLITQITQSSHC